MLSRPEATTAPARTATVYTGRARAAGQIDPDLAPDATPHVGRFRGDIEGMRAVAVGLVLLYHAGLPFIRGGFVGVDVFFVISGFLITTLLVSELDRTGRISLPSFYARRAKRLLPATAVVLVTTGLLTVLLLPKTQWRVIGGDIVASAAYVTNWRLADRAVDYLAEDVVPSPVQHFWSLAVEEQFYLVWPLLILIAALIARRIGKPVKPVMYAGLSILLVPSFLWSVFESSTDPARAFFVSTTRVWELAVGAFLALSAGVVGRLAKPVAGVLGWAGLVAVVLSGLRFSPEMSWPGYAALVPVLGTAAVIAAGLTATPSGPARLLGTRPMRVIGGLSYSLYLWHWPLLAVAAAAWGKLSVPAGLGLVALSAIPAGLTYRYVENPIRSSKTISRSPRLALSLGANFSLVGVATGLIILTMIEPAQLPSGMASSALGAAVLKSDPRDDPAGAPVDEVGWMIPTPTTATADVHRSYADGCQQVFEKSDVVTCVYGDPGAKVTVAVIGDSKAAQWLAALDPLAVQNHWRLVTYLKSSCAFAEVRIVYDSKEYTQCRTWADEVLKRVLTNPPDYIITSQGKGKAVDATGNETTQAMVSGLKSAWRQLIAAGSKVIVLADNPGPSMNVYECAEKNPHKLTACAFDRQRAQSSAAVAQAQAVDGLDGARLIDLTYAICPTERCAAVIGNVLIYRQGTHITATYIKTMAPRLATALTSAGLRSTYQPGA